MRPTRDHRAHRHRQVADWRSTSLERLGGEVGAEIVNADAMQLYRGMDIGTAKLPVEQRRGIPIISSTS